MTSRGTAFAILPLVVAISSSALADVNTQDQNDWLACLAPVFESSGDSLPEFQSINTRTILHHAHRLYEIPETIGAQASELSSLDSQSNASVDQWIDYLSIPLFGFQRQPNKLISLNGKLFLRKSTSLQEVTAGQSLIPVSTLSASSNFLTALEAKITPDTHAFLIIDDDNQVYAFDGTVFESMAKSSDTGRVQSAFGVNTTIWIVAENGLFTFKTGATLQTIILPKDILISDVQDVIYAAEHFWMQAKNQIFVFDQQKNIFNTSNATDTGIVGGIVDVPSRDLKLVLTEKGVFTFSKDGLLSPVPGGEIGPFEIGPFEVNSSPLLNNQQQRPILFEVGNEVLLLSPEGLFVYQDDGTIEPVADGTNLAQDGDVKVVWTKERAAFRTSSAFFTYVPGQKVDKIAFDEDTTIYQRWELHSAAGRIFASGDEGLFELSTQGTLSLIASNTKFNLRSAPNIVAVNGRFYANANSELFEIGEKEMIRIPGAGNVGVFKDQLQLVGQDLYHSTIRFLNSQGQLNVYRLIHDLISPSSFKILTDESKLLPNATDDQLLKLQFDHSCSPFVGNALPVYLAVIPADGDTEYSLLRRVDKGKGSNTEFIADIRIPADGKYTLRLATRDGERYIFRGPTQKLTIHQSLIQRVLVWLNTWKVVIAFAILALHTVIYLSLIALARRSERAFRLLFDPVFDKFGFWFYAALRYSPLLHRWLMSRWYDVVRQRFMNQLPAYLPVPLNEIADDTLREEKTFSSDQLPSYWPKTPHVWINAPSGMGKTALVKALERQYFAEPSLSAAYQRFGVLPIIVAARAARDIPVDPDDPGGWVVRAVGEVLATYRFEIRDQGLLRSFLRSGSLGIILDGLNEVDREAEVIKFAETMRDTPMIVTSQRNAPEEARGVNWLRLSLPETVESFLDDLLACYLDREVASEVMATIAVSGLRKDIVSGFDARLIVELSDRENSTVPLPGDRISLYAAMLHGLVLPDGSRLAIKDLGKVAWDKVQAGDRRFTASDLGADIVSTLTDSKRRILRVVGSDRYEFRHDQMRAYLAAHYLYDSPPSNKARENWLTTSTIWTRDRTDQRALFDFLAAMQSDPKGLLELRNFAMKDDARAAMAYACQDVANKRDWAF